MLDKDCRKKAEQWMERRLDYKTSDRRFYYTKALEWYLQIKKPTDEDRRAIAEIYCSVAVADFNDDNNSDAVENYKLSVQQLLLIEPQSRRDADYRKLTELYLDLADTFVYFHNRPAFDESNEFAMQAFSLIKHKTAGELALGDPRVNFQPFFEHFQKETSALSYLASASFKNHKHILKESQKKRHEEQTMADLFGGICIDEVNQGLGAMMDGLAFTNAAIPSFTPIQLDQPSSDVDYRALAIEYLRLTQTHIQQGEVLDTIKTWKEALQAMNSVQEKTESDRLIINQIDQQISYLKDKMSYSEEDSDTEYDDDDDDETYDDHESHDDVTLDQSESKPLPEQNQQVANSLIAKMNMFSRADRTRPGAYFDEDLEQNEQANHQGHMNYDW